MPLFNSRFHTFLRRNLLLLYNISLQTITNKTSAMQYRCEERSATTLLRVSCFLYPLSLLDSFLCPHNISDLPVSFSACPNALFFPPSRGSTPLPTLSCLAPLSPATLPFLHPSLFVCASSLHYGAPRSSSNLSSTTCLHSLSLSLSKFSSLSRCHHFLITPTCPLSSSRVTCPRILARTPFPDSSTYRPFSA